MVKKAQRAGDKYYRLAKQQGYRARSAFKLIQMNRQYDFLSSANILLDLCAAPGGWCQVAAKFMPVESKIVGVDLVPIKPIPGVKTFCEDITTQKCRQTLRNEFKDKQCDVVLHDGAGNVGGGWSKDAFDQNSLTLHALKLATEFLKRGGLFITKVFRSADYTSLMYIFNQLFGHVQATKPLSSRSESAEIFVVCENYLAPNIDPRLLDPNYAFKQVQGEQKPLLIFDKNAGVQHRFREGYDESLGIGLKRVISVDDFVRRDDPLRVLTDANELSFDEASDMYKNSQFTNDEVIECCKDLRVLNKGDFKTLLKWRLNLLHQFKKELKGRMIRSKKTLHDHLSADLDRNLLETIEDTEEKEEKEKEKQEEETEEEKKKKEQEDKDIEEKLAELRERLALKSKKEKKRLQKELSKKKRRELLGLNNNSVDVQMQDIFDINTIKTKEDFDAFHEVDLETQEVDDIDEEEREAKRKQKEEEKLEEEVEDMDALLETQLDNWYSAFKEKRAAQDREYVQRLEKEKGLPAKKIKEQRELQQLFDEELDKDKEAYKDLMNKKRATIDDENDLEDNRDEEEVLLEEEEDKEGYLEHKIKDKKPTLSNDQKVANWFSDSIFNGIHLDGLDPKVKQQKKNEQPNKQLDIADEDMMLLESDDAAKNSDDTSDVDSDYEEVDEKNEKKFERNRKRRAEEEEEEEGEKENVWGEMPLTDKERRHQKRLRNIERKNRKEPKADDLEVVEKEFYHANRPVEGVNQEYQDMIKQGMGKTIENPEDDAKLEIVKKFDPKMGSEDHINALAIGELLSHPSTARDFIDSCYNRYAFTDSEDLPQWFVDDEKKHNRPQLPITKEAVDRIRNRFREKNNTPIRKELEAQGRKQRRMQKAREKAKNKIDSINNDEDMTDSSKLRAIQRLLKGRTAAKPGKQYVVSTKGKQNKHSHNSKSVKLVDKRMKSDSRNARLKMKHKRSGGRRK